MGWLVSLSLHAILAVKVCAQWGAGLRGVRRRASGCEDRVLNYVEMFRRTVAQASVYPREVLKDAMARNSAALLLVHGHPSGLAEPSPADQALTRTLKAALSLVDVRVLDHLIVDGCVIYSMAEHGLM